MRLRYLRLANVPPLEDIAITFGHETVLGRDCAIRFVVGVNGTGKSRLLQSLAQIFLCLERPMLPPFPITLVYDLGIGEIKYTIYLRHQHGQKDSHSVLVKYPFLTDSDIQELGGWENLPEVTEKLSKGDKRKELRHYCDKENILSSGTWELLPNPLLVYVAGGTHDWEFIFSPPPQTKISETKGLEDDKSLSKRSIFMSTANLRLAVCAVTMLQAWHEFKAMQQPADETNRIDQIKQAIVEQHYQNSLQMLLSETGWLWPIALSFEMMLDFKNLKKDTFDNHTNKDLYRLGKIATAITKPSELHEHHYLFQFDLYVPQAPQKTAKNIQTFIEVFKAEDQSTVTAFDIFKRLYEWQQQGILQNVNIALQKIDVLDDVVLYDWLSDGEQLFLGRMALFHLLKDEDMNKSQDALIILDEPETHFNDVWKRRIVDIIDDSLGKNATDVVISTHSSVALTDAFKEEITLLVRDIETNKVSVLPTPMSTFGALPNEIMWGIFGADSIGQRAQEYLDLVLKLVELPDEINQIWDMLKRKESKERIMAQADFAKLWQHSRSLIQHEDKLYYVLQFLHQYTQQETRRQEVDVVTTLAVLEKQIGPSFYQFEVGHRLQALRRRRNHATQS